MFTQLLDSVQPGYQKITYIVGTISYYDLWKHAVLNIYKNKCKFVTGQFINTLKEATLHFTTHCTQYLFSLSSLTI